MISFQANGLVQLAENLSTDYAGTVPTCQASPLQDLVQVLANIAKEIDKERFDENYWADQKFKAQPFYKLGENLRTTFDVLTGAFEFGIQNIFTSISDWLNPLEQEVMYEINKAVIYNDVDELNYYLEHKERRIQRYAQNRIKLHDHKKTELAKKLSFYYQLAEQIILKANERAKNSGKKLFILLGEDHESKETSIIQLIILDIITSQFKLAYVFDENFGLQSYIKGGRCNFKNNFCDLQPIGVRTKFLHEREIRLEPIDLATCGNAELYFNDSYVPQPCELIDDDIKKQQIVDRCELVAEHKLVKQYAEKAMSADGMVLRNRVMVKTIFKSEKTNCNEVDVAIVGDCHIKGILEDEHNFLSQYMVLPIYLQKPIEESCEMNVLSKMLQLQLHLTDSEEHLLSSKQMIFSVVGKAKTQHNTNSVEYRSADKIKYKQCV